MASSGAPNANGTPLRQEAGKVIHTIGLGAGPAAAPFVAAALLPVCGVAVLVAELVFVLILFGIVVYGTQEHADRVFRLLRWLRSRPEPPAPASLYGDNSLRISRTPAQKPFEPQKTPEVDKFTTGHSGE